MSDYIPPLTDMMFTLTELANLDAITALPDFSETTEELVQAVLDEGGKFFSQVLAPLNRVGDVQGLSLDAAGVHTPPGFKETYQQLVDDGWISLAFPAEEGGQGLPRLVDLVIVEMMHAANSAFAMCPGLAAGAASAIRANASEELKALYLPKIASGVWSTAMCLTEPQSGSDLSGVRTRAIPAGDHYLITGQKIFISWADHDMAENIVHLVLARTPDGPAGTRGLSLFIVPKFIPHADGSLGPRNDWSVVSLEHKLGLHASPTCAVSYGDNGGATGYLVGKENQGLAAMFVMMNHIRVQVGSSGPALTERAYQQALAFAQERVQGSIEGRQVVIIQHADVRRMLLTMKSGIDAMRALVYVTAASIDLDEYSDTGDSDTAARIGLLTPIVKAWCTEFSQELIGLAVQVHGGMGFVEETGVAQHLRDARILTIFEGTSAIQSMDLVRRKLLKDGGRAFKLLTEDMRIVLRESDSGSITRIKGAFGQAVSRLEETAQWILENQDGEETVLGGIAFDFMMLAGYVAGGWQMTRAAIIAETRLAEGAGNSDLYRQKIATAVFYAEHILPRVESHALVVLNGGASVMAMEFVPGGGV